MTDMFHEEDGVPAATRVIIGACGCPQVHIMLLDETGTVFAKAVMSPEEFADAAGAVATYVAATRAEQGDTIGDVAGSA